MANFFTRTCGVCGEEFSWSQPRAGAPKKFCSEVCRAEGYRKTGREYWKTTGTVNRVVREYGIDREDYKERVRRGICECCGNLFGKRGPCVDHCHSTGKVRGVVCSGCNIGLGHLESRGEALATYLGFTLLTE